MSSLLYVGEALEDDEYEDEDEEDEDGEDDDEEDDEDFEPQGHPKPNTKLTFTCLLLSIPKSVHELFER